MRWLVISVALSVVLTVLINVGLRMSPGAAHRVARRLSELVETSTDDARTNRRGVRVLVPWKTMIIGSVILTVVINVLLWIS